MEQSRPPYRRVLPWILAILLLAVGIAVFRERSESEHHLLPLRLPDGLTGLRVWGAGMRFADGKSFCGCARVPRPWRVYYETRDVEEVRGLISLIQVRVQWPLEATVANCGQVTIDFMKGDEVAFWMNVHGTDLIVPKAHVPITSGSQEDITAWLNQRKVYERIQADLQNPPAK